MSGRLGSVLVSASLLMPLANPAVAEPVDPTPPFIIELQNAIRNDDKTWLADHLHLPVNYFGKTKQVISSKDWFLKHYAAVIGPELKANVLKQDPETYFKNYQGVTVGDGGRNIWLDDFGDEGAGVPARFEIITINDSD
ncbi:MAG TPA: hypothetical protein VLD66_09040 [Methyloceanibacter sp.]|nr:hypothetical protein [Methyloceanibacter sp.]